MFRYFEERGRTAAFAVHSLLPAFQATEQFPLVFDSDPHWNTAGHEFVAQTLASSANRPTAGVQSSGI